MNEQIVDLSFVDHLHKMEKTMRERYTDILREGFQHKMSHLHDDVTGHDDTRGALDYVKDLINQGTDVSKELAQLDQYINDITLAVGLVKHAANRRAEVPTQFWTESEHG